MGIEHGEILETLVWALIATGTVYCHIGRHCSFDRILLVPDKGRVLKQCQQLASATKNSQKRVK